MILTTAAKVQILDKMAQLKSKKAKPFDFKPNYLSPYAVSLSNSF